MQRLFPHTIAWPCALAALSCGDAAGPDSVSIECDTPAMAISGGTTQSGSTSPTLDQLTVALCPIDLGSGEVTVVFTINARDSGSGITRP